MSKPFNIHDWQAKQAKQLLNEDEGVDHKERLVQTIVNVFNGRLGNWYQDQPTSMNDVQKLFNRDREAIANIIRQHLRDVNVDPGVDLEEMNTTGTGASFQAGAGEGYMTPNAFKKKRKED